MSLEEIVIPELFERLRYDVDQLGVELHRLQRFVEVRLEPDAWRQAGDIQGLKQFVELCLRHDVTQMAADVLRLQRFVELSLASRIWPTKAENSSAPAPAPEPEPSASEPVEYSARQRLEADAHAAATQMVERVNLMRQQKQSTATSLAYALRAAREASAGFECSQTMKAIIKALDEIGTATREATSHG